MNIINKLKKANKLIILLLNFSYVNNDNSMSGFDSFEKNLQRKFPQFYSKINIFININNLSNEIRLKFWQHFINNSNLSSHIDLSKVNLNELSTRLLKI